MRTARAQRSQSSQQAMFRVRFQHKTSKSSDCPYHQCSTCDEIGHSEQNCPQAECDVCNLFGHIDTICPFRDCCDVAIDWLNIVLLCRTQFTISAHFSDGEVTSSLDDLRIDGVRVHITRICRLATSARLMRTRRHANHGTEARVSTLWTSVTRIETTKACNASWICHLTIRFISLFENIKPTRQEFRGKQTTPPLTRPSVSIAMRGYSHKV